MNADSEGKANGIPGRSRRGAGDLIQPEKEAENKKIDGVTGLMMCLNRALRRDQPAAARVRVISMEEVDQVTDADHRARAAGDEPNDFSD